MFRKAAAKKKLGAREGFHWRGGEELTRIEGLSDAVFGFAITLLIVSTEVPRTYEELIGTLQGFIAFAICFLLLMGMWYKHYLYFRRYNLDDTRSIILTMVLLFIVLFYTYPLKFVFMSIFGGPKYRTVVDTVDHLSILFTIYGAGFIAVYIVFTLMYYHAYQMRDTLKLTELEIWDTNHEWHESLMSCGVGLVSVLVANLGEPWVYFSGAAYALMGFVGWGHGTWSRKRRAAIYEKLYGDQPVATA